MNWETKEVNLIVMNTVGLYDDVTNGVDVEDIVVPLKHILFSHVDLDRVDFDHLRSEYQEYIDEL